MLFLNTRGRCGRCGRIVGGRRGVIAPLSLFIGGGIIFARSNLDNRLIGIQGVGCGGLGTCWAQFDTWLGYVIVLPLICAMHSLDTASAAELKTHFGCGVSLLILLAGVGSQFLSEDVLEEGERPYIREHTLLRLVTRVVRMCVLKSYVHRGASVVSPASIDLQRRDLIKSSEAPNLGSTWYR
jgi:hypothetical protein